jgi:DMSO/TMAO reductase YedYZ heme-binding membrane subunit
MGAFFEKIRPLLEIFFKLHDIACDFIARYFMLLKKSILLFAFLSLIGVFYPEALRQYGELAGNLLIFLLFLSPLSRIFRMRILLQLMGFRRELGILMGYLALVHGLGFLTQYGGLSLFHFPLDPLLFSPFVMFGCIGLFLIFPLLLTSNSISVKFFGSFWKKIHFLVYPAFFFIILHRMLAGVDSGSVMKIFEAIILIGSYGMLKVFAWRPFSLSAKNFIDLIAREYGIYRQKTN